MGEDGELPLEEADGAKGMQHEAARNWIATSDRVRRLVEHPALNDFGPLLLPWVDNSCYFEVPLSRVGTLMPYHDHVDPVVVVQAINRLISDVNDGKTVFLDFYTERQKRSHPDKKHTGLFFFRGKPGAPFAIVCPGGGFSYVGSLHEGFPLGVEISEQGYNAFVIRYRTGSQMSATEDLAAAITYVFRNAKALDISTDAYSLWGGSAGARMVGNIALSGTADYGGGTLPKPSAVIIAYTAQSTYSNDFPPAFFTVSADDPIVNAADVRRRVERLRAAGVRVEFSLFKKAGHGFGLGTGTDAEGWLARALRFWRDQMD